MSPWAFVLVVDDDPVTRGKIAGGLRRAGCKVGTAQNAIGAFLEALRRPYDLVLLDVEMPGLSGTDALPYLRSCAPGTPIVAMTHCPRKEQERAMSRGAQCVLHKPVDLDILIGLVRLFIGRRRRPVHERPIRPLAPFAPAWEGRPA